MNYDEAYAEGFCKTAEAAGIDPSELMKVAFMGAFKNTAKAVKGMKAFGGAARQAATTGLRQGLGRTIGGFQGQGIGGALRDVGQLGGETLNYARQIPGAFIQDIGHGIRTNARWMGRNARQAANRAGQYVKDTAQAMGNDIRQGYNAANGFLQRNPLAGVGLGTIGGGLIGGATMYGLSRMGNGNQ